MTETYWRTLDGRRIPIRFMTTTHLGNAMTHQTRVFDEVYPPLLEEWHRREGEGICRKAYRCFCRVLGNYYKGSARFTAKKKEKFKELNEQALAIQKARQKFLNAIAQANDDCYDDEGELAPQGSLAKALNDKTRIPAKQVFDGGLDQG